MPRPLDRIFRVELANEADIVNRRTASCYGMFVAYARKDTRKISGNPGPPYLYSEGALTETPTDGFFGETVTIPFQGDVVSCHISKSKRSPAGSFSMNMTRGNIDYSAYLHPGDHVLIWMRSDHVDINNIDPQKDLGISQNGGFKMWGIIDDIVENRQTDDSGTTHISYAISGRDFGYFFLSDLYYNSVIVKQLQGSGVTDATASMIAAAGGDLSDQTRVKLPPDDIVKIFVNAFLDNPRITIQGRDLTESVGVNPNQMYFIPDPVFKMFNNQFSLADLVKNKKIGGNVSELKAILVMQSGIFKYDDPQFQLLPSKSESMSGIRGIDSVIGSNKTLWSTLLEYSEPVINEMFTELIPDNRGDLHPTLIHRQIPFSSKVFATANDGATPFTEFLSIPRFVIPNSLIKNESMGRSSSLRVNFVTANSIYASLDRPGDQASIAIGAYGTDFASARRYGVRTMFGQVSYFVDKKNTNQSQQTGFLELKYVSLLNDWWTPAHLYDSGSISFYGTNQYIPVGYNIEVRRPDHPSADFHEVYHIESIDHSFDIDFRGERSFMTTVSVTRGQDSTGRPIFQSRQELYSRSNGYSGSSFISTSRAPFESFNPADKIKEKG